MVYTAACKSEFPKLVWTFPALIGTHKHTWKLSVNTEKGINNTWMAFTFYLGCSVQVLVVFSWRDVAVISNADSCVLRQGEQHPPVGQVWIPEMQEMSDVCIAAHGIAYWAVKKAAVCFSVNSLHWLCGLVRSWPGRVRAKIDQCWVQFWAVTVNFI